MVVLKCLVFNRFLNSFQGAVLFSLYCTCCSFKLSSKMVVTYISVLTEDHPVTEDQRCSSFPLEFTNFKH